MKKLVAVTPAKNEEKYIKKCIESVLNQTYPVKLHLIVDDQSVDNTPKIVKEFKDPRVKLVSSGLKRIPVRQRGLRPHLVQQIGIDKVTKIIPDWEYLLLLDGDCWIPRKYCETIIREMERDKFLGLAGAKYLVTPKIIEVSSEIHVRSSNHIIKRRFYNLCIKNKIDYATPKGEILLEKFAMVSGWKVRTISIQAYEGRPTGKGKGPLIVKGIHEYQIGTPLIFLLTNLRKPTKERVYRVLGWTVSKLRGEYRYFNQEQIKILRRQHFSLLIKRFKKRITGR